MFFLTKNDTKGNVVDKIKQMSARGISDRDIIKQLKADGFNYNDIERGMLEALRQGVVIDETGSPQAQRAPGAAPSATQRAPPQAGPPARYATAPAPQPRPIPMQPTPNMQQGAPRLPTNDNMSQYNIKQTLPSEAQVMAFEEMSPEDFEVEMDEQFDIPQRRAGPSAPRHIQKVFEEQEEIAPELIIEELVEGVVDEKWDKFDKKLKELESGTREIRTSVAQFREELMSKLEGRKQQSTEKDVLELAKRYEELDARVGGLEKAFKQFLPSLTGHIESLRQMVHDMKNKSAEEPV